MPAVVQSDNAQILLRQYVASLPHSSALGQEIVRIGRGEVRMRQPYAHGLLGDPQQGLIHTSVQFSLVDSALGAAVLSGFERMEAIATLDLRMDYHRPAVADLDLFVDARIDRISRQIVFVSAQVWQKEPQEITAMARATFMRGASRRSAVAEHG